MNAANWVEKQFPTYLREMKVAAWAEQCQKKEDKKLDENSNETFDKMYKEKKDISLCETVKYEIKSSRKIRIQ